ncbi:hypothetical protein RIF25_13020 [Thermosynechococcaceae cyanobacterium BACA0444]|uniref:Uncharacterized protein n=1 Tax=Pseudocalidococcus azoricus BACA0444 TaxID=2918990 RepID=A0AAE4FT39_9CYAN|nr:hypothetical protein [Pseudocalidococcus azoricus]MDS3861725.1 hypothetical protein [Pseudocalidococcus azoricus BACA0444]
MSLLVYEAIGFTQAPQPTVRLSTEPSLEDIRPFEAEASTNQLPTRFTVQAIDASGQPLKNATVHLQLLTPLTTPWFTTDFPIVEGTTLLDLKTLAPAGEVQFQQMMPTRGVYQLKARVTPQVANAFAPFEQTLPISVSENGVKYQNFAILAAVLLLAGLVGGWVIGQRRGIQPGEIAPKPVRLLLSAAVVVAIAALLYVNVSAEVAQSHHSMAMSHLTEVPPPAPYPSQRQEDGLKAQLSGDQRAVVGRLANFQVSITDARTQQPVTDVMVKVRATQMENGWISFAYNGTTDSTGQLRWQEQFFDGASHQIDVEVTPRPISNRQFRPLQIAQTLEVEGIAPPLHVRLISLCYMTGIVAIGLLLGLQLQQRRSNQAE